MPIYPALAIAAAVAVVALELVVLRSGLFRQPAYWVAMAIVYAFMVPVDGWLTKLSAPIVLVWSRRRRRHSPRRAAWIGCFPTIWPGANGAR